jgi:hypothetical protein
VSRCFPRRRSGSAVRHDACHGAIPPTVAGVFSSGCPTLRAAPSAVFASRPPLRVSGKRSTSARGSPGARRCPGGPALRTAGRRCLRADRASGAARRPDDLRGGDALRLPARVHPHRAALASGGAGGDQRGLRDPRRRGSAGPGHGAWAAWGLMALFVAVFPARTWTWPSTGFRSGSSRFRARGSGYDFRPMRSSSPGPGASRRLRPACRGARERGSGWERTGHDGPAGGVC